MRLHARAAVEGVSGSLRLMESGRYGEDATVPGRSFAAIGLREDFVVTLAALESDADVASKTVARLMKDMGCVDAIALSGGGRLSLPGDARGKDGGEGQIVLNVYSV
ncbi:MAG: hypothetical protein M5R36_22035 [Deltaproteobacteria bacterium]|nr:hypothetical protein [Deltaproteobacteria bacterium]